MTAKQRFFANNRVAFTKQLFLKKPKKFNNHGIYLWSVCRDQEGVRPAWVVVIVHGCRRKHGHQFECRKVPAHNAVAVVCRETAAAVRGRRTLTVTFWNIQVVGLKASCYGDSTIGCYGIINYTFSPSVIDWLLWWHNELWETWSFWKHCWYD